jgi:hypothetical protein
MQKTAEQKDKVIDKKSLFEFFTEIIGWLQIVASPFLAASIVGAIIYFSRPNTTRLIIAIAILTIGLVVGIIWATRVWRKKGTIHFMSRIMATPEFDNNDEDQK